MAHEPEPVVGEAAPPQAAVSIGQSGPVTADAAEDGAGAAATETPEQAPTAAAADTAEIATPEPPVLEPVIKPIVIGSDVEAPAVRKRGWWRR